MGVDPRRWRVMMCSVMKSAVVLLTVLAVLGVIAPATAGEQRLDALVISDSWARATPGRVRNGVAFVTIQNRGRHADRLIAVSTPAAARAAFHTHVIKAGVMKMRSVAAVKVAADAITAMKPGGFHIMLMGLAAPLVESESFPLTLTFERAGTLTLEVTVMTIGARHGRK